VQSIATAQEFNLKIWEKLRLVVGQGDRSGIYEARVEDFINGGVVVTSPQLVSGHTLLRNGLGVTIQLTREDAAYQFNSTVRLKKGDHRRRVILTPPRRLQRIQRRQFARVDHFSFVEAAPLLPNRDWSTYRTSFTWHSCETANISAGGMLMTNEPGFREGVLGLLKVRFLQEADLPSEVFAECRRTFRRDGRAYCGVQFVLAHQITDHLSFADFRQLPVELLGFDEQAQDRLASYLFRLQIELRQKGLI
jgi:c-di-GMP-binding flagellar brake protein YcgR